MTSDCRKNDEVIIETINGVKALLEEKFDSNAKEHQSLIEQTTKTNGRVTGLENRESSLNGGFKVLMGVITMCSVVVPFVYYLMISNLKYEINENVLNALNKHTIESDKKFEQLRIEMHSTAKEEIENFANKNFEEYNK